MTAAALLPNLAAVPPAGGPLPLVVPSLAPPRTMVTATSGPSGDQRAARGEPAEEVPAPPAADPGALPSDSRPHPLPGVTRAYQCAGGQHRPEPPKLPELLWGQRALRLPQLERLSTGSGTRIAVIDTGVAPHPLLAGRLIAGGDYVAGGTGLDDCDGHGTAVAGIAAGALDASGQFAGVAPAAQVIAIRQSSPSFTVPGPDGRREPAGNLTTLAKAVVHAVELGADVINISEVACAPPDAPGSAALRAAIHAAVARNVVVVAAAGNTGTGAAGECPDGHSPGTVVYPAWFDDDVLTVAALGPDGLAAPFSVPGPWVDVAAPGERLVSLAADGSGLTDQLAGVTARTALDGTSFAAPAVAGLAALIRAKYPHLTARQVMGRITATADQHGSGHGDTLGYGLVNPLAALTQTPAVLPPPATATVDAHAVGRLAFGGATSAPAAKPAVGSAPASTALGAAALALLAAVFAGRLAVGRLRAGWRAEPRTARSTGSGGLD